jgi:two-component system phosphate regulon response regulator OmpR
MQAQQRQKILVVDDDLRLRDLLKRYLSEQGFAVDTVPDAAAMDRSLTRVRYDLMVLDLNMPGLTGLETLPKLREALPDAKIVVLTTSRAIESERAAMAAGADAYVPKPIDATSVPRLVREKFAA